MLRHSRVPNGGYWQNIHKTRHIIIIISPFTPHYIQTCMHSLISAVQYSSNGGVLINTKCLWTFPLKWTRHSETIEWRIPVSLHRAGPHIEDDHMTIAYFSCVVPFYSLTYNLTTSWLIIMGAIKKGLLIEYCANGFAPWQIGTYVCRYWKRMKERKRVLNVS